MKKVMTIFGAIIFASVILTSCGGGNKDKTGNEIEVTPKSVNVTGALSDYFEIVEGKYKLAISESSQELKVQFKRTDEEFDFDAPYLAGLGYFKVKASCLEESGTPVTGFDDASGTDFEKIFGLKSGETSWITFTFYGENAEKIKMFEINTEAKLAMDEMKEVKGAALGSNSSDGGESSSASSSVDCDQFIKDYSDFVDSYIKLLKKYKANPTDASILTEYTEAAQKAADMQTNASSCTDPKYATKLMELANKIAKAAM
jgi:hypothetical protein